MKGHKTLLMNVRSYNFEGVCQAARVMKELDPSNQVIVGGMHATVSPDSMKDVKEFDKIDVPSRCSLEDVENSIRVWNDALQHPEKSKMLRTQEGAAVEVKNTDAV